MQPNIQFPLNPAAQPGTNQQVNGWVDQTAQGMPQLQPPVMQPLATAQPVAQPLGVSQVAGNGTVNPVGAPPIHPGYDKPINPVVPPTPGSWEEAHQNWLAAKPPTSIGDYDAYRAATNAWMGQKPVGSHQFAPTAPRGPSWFGARHG